MRWTVLVILVLCASLAQAASLESTNSGIFRGSLRHTITFEESDRGGDAITVPNVHAGDFLSVRLPGAVYDYNKFEKISVYIRRHDRSGDGVAAYDFGSEKFLELPAGEEVELDFSGDGKADVGVKFMGIDLQTGAYELRLLGEPSENDEEVSEETVNDTESPVEIVPSAPPEPSEVPEPSAPSESPEPSAPSEPPVPQATPMERSWWQRLWDWLSGF